MGLSQKLKVLRKKKGLSQFELAEVLCVSRQAISSWEAGTSRPSTENLQSLSKLFSIPLEILLDDTATAEPEKVPLKDRLEEEHREPELGKGKQRKLFAIVILLLLVVLTATVVRILSGTEKENSDKINFSEMESEILSDTEGDTVELGELDESD